MLFDIVAVARLYAQRLPRSRGDGPDSRPQPWRQEPAPPLARGWTPGENAGVSCVRAPPLARGWTLTSVGAAPRAAPPLARGWTPVRRARAWRSRLPRSRGDGPCSSPSLTPRGSPARAGMDPLACSDLRGRRLPRSRGDGPCALCAGTRSGHGSPARAGMDPDHAVSVHGRCRAPPHARGWTRSAPDRRGSRGGSPARAGMDPAKCSALAGGRLPRSRGDGPPAHRSSVSAAPPLARGWTLPLTIEPWRQRGSPARAGMDPAGAADRAVMGSPARAGMDPYGSTGPTRSLEAPPLARGWTRIDDQPRLQIDLAPPLARGWTPETIVDARAQRLPRSRGDGPSATSA